MLKRSFILATALAAGVAASGVVHGQKVDQEPTVPDAVSTRLDRLNGNLERIVALLERQLKAERLALVFDRAELSLRRIEAVESRLSQVRAERSALSKDIQNVEVYLESLGVDPEGSTPAAQEAFREQRRQAEHRLELLESRQGDLDQRILDLEGELIERRNGLQALEDQLDRELAGR